MNSENFPVAARDANKAVTLVTTKPDEELATELRDKFAAAFREHLIPIMDEITAAGFVLNFNTQLMPGIPPRHQLINLLLSKVLAS
jgi:hypothetical protein